MDGQRVVTDPRKILINVTKTIEQSEQSYVTASGTHCSHRSLIDVDFQEHITEALGEILTDCNGRFLYTVIERY